MVEVDPGFRRRGLATAMLDYVLRYQFDGPMTVSWGATTSDGEALRRAWKDPGHYRS
jgi:ribosomal protein S18 acetylase RimI-like enzyme